MGNMDECLDALAHRLAIQVGHTKFSNHVMDVVASGDHPGALFKHRDNLADHRTILHGIGGRHGNDRNAAFRAGSP